EHAAEIDSIDFDDNEFDDLEAFGKAVGNARMVMLGEQTHGDGTAFRAKARLIRFLHEELGFDVLAFESGFYDMHKVWERIRAGDDAAKAARSGMFGMWSQSRQVRPLIDYIGERADSSRPLELTGFDCQFSGRASKDHLVDDLVEFLAKHGFDVATIADWPRSRGAIQKVVESRAGPDRRLSAEERDLVFAAIETLSGRIAGIDNADGA